MKDLFNLLELYFKNDKDIEIELINDEILFSINEKRNYRELRLFIKNEFIIINDFSYENEINDNKDISEYEIELFRLNHILFEYDEMRMNLLIIQFLKNFIDIIE